MRKKVVWSDAQKKEDAEIFFSLRKWKSVKSPWLTVIVKHDVMLWRGLIMVIHTRHGMITARSRRRYRTGLWCVLTCLLTRRPLHDVCALVHLEVFSFAHKSERTVEWVSQSELLFDAQRPQMWQMHFVKSRFWDLTFSLGYVLANFQFQCYYRFLQSERRRIFSYIKENGLWLDYIVEISRVRVNLSDDIRDNCRGKFKEKIRNSLRRMFCETLYFFLSRYSLVCSDPLFMCPITLTSSSHSFKLVTWSWFGPVVGCCSSHLIIFNRW